LRRHHNNKGEWQVRSGRTRQDVRRIAKKLHIHYQGETSMPVINMYKENPTMTLNPEERFPFSFGQKKAQLIVDNIEAIKLFAQDPEKAKQLYAGFKKEG